MRRPLGLLVGLGLAFTLTLTPTATGQNGGIAPPDPTTSSGETILGLYWLVFVICAVVFVLVEGTLVLFIVRYRRRGRAEHAEGAQIHGHTRLELIWTAVPAAIFVGIAALTVVVAPAIRADDGTGGGVAISSDALRVRVEAHQFYWQYVYPNDAISLDILRLPVDREVALEMIGTDVIHSWWVPRLTGKLDAIPGLQNVLVFTPEQEGSFRGQCAELCGIEHALMETTVEVVSEAEYERWVAAQAPARTEPIELGRETWQAVCAKCHGDQGQGGSGPPIASNPILTDVEALRRLALTGQDTPRFPGFMPAVGSGWPDRQFEALAEYLREEPPSGAQDGER